MRTARKLPAPKEEALGRALGRFRNLLHERSLKMSKVRESIARTALTYEGHFSVEDLLQILQADGVRDAHMATIYRAMPLMVEAGLIQPALVSKNEGQLYEAAFEREHHDHLICVLCGCVIEYQSEALEALQREIAARYGFELDAHVHELRGRCKRCRDTLIKPGFRRPSVRPERRFPIESQSAARSASGAIISSDRARSRRKDAKNSAR